MRIIFIQSTTVILQQSWRHTVNTITMHLSHTYILRALQQCELQMMAANISNSNYETRSIPIWHLQMYCFQHSYPILIPLMGLYFSPDILHPPLSSVAFVSWGRVSWDRGLPELKRKQSWAPGKIGHPCIISSSDWALCWWLWLSSDDLASSSRTQHQLGGWGERLPGESYSVLWGLDNAFGWFKQMLSKRC